MRYFTIILFASVAAVIAAFGTAQAQSSAAAPPPPPPPAVYGPSINYEMAKKMMAAAEAEAVKNNWNMVITILDTGGNRVMQARMDNSLLASINVSEGKARTAVGFRRPSKALEDAIAGGGAALRTLSVHGEGVFVQGGLPIVVDGKVVGAIGASGGTSPQDEQVAQAGLNALK
jgi:glc operon protein GlcG